MEEAAGVAGRAEAEREVRVDLGRQGVWGGDSSVCWMRIRMGR